MSVEPNNDCSELEERLRFETLIADLSLKFVNLPADEVDREIIDAQRQHLRDPRPRSCGALAVVGGGRGNFKLSHLYSIDGGQHLARVDERARGLSLVPAADAGGPHRCLFYDERAAGGGRPGP